MTIFSWNVRGLGKPHAKRVLKNVVQAHSTHLVFFQETKMFNSQMERVRIQTGF